MLGQVDTCTESTWAALKKTSLIHLKINVTENSFYKLFPETVQQKTLTFLQKLDKSEKETYEL